MRQDVIESILAPINGATFATLDTQTEQPLRGGKANPHQGRIVKRCLGNRVMLFTNKKSSGYDNMVKRRLEQAGLDPDSFECGPLPWGQRVPNSPFIEHRGKRYLQVIFQEAGDVKYFYRRQDGEYFPIEKDDIQGLPLNSGSEHQGLEPSKQVICRTYALDSILAIRAFNDEGEDDAAIDVGLWHRD
jgi:hypothetical protein